MVSNHLIEQTLVEFDMTSPTRGFDRLPPHSVEAEMCLLGSMMLAGDRPDLLSEVAHVVSDQDFFQADHQILFRVVMELHRAESPVDGIIVREELIRRKMLEDIGGLDYLADILTAVPNYAHARNYAAIVREKAVLRRLITISNDAIRDAYAASDHDRAVELCRRLADKGAALASDGTTDPVVTLAQAADRVLARQDDTGVRRISTGIASLDAVMGGLAKSKMTLVGADPRVGKSTLIKQIVRNAAGAGVRCGLTTIEEDQEKVAENMLANQSGIPNHQIAYGNLSADEWAGAHAARAVFEGLPYLIDDAQSELDDVIASVERMATKYGCELIAVDHLHLIACDGQTREREVSRISKALKAAFKRLNVAGLVACQLNRGQDSKQKPQLRNLRDSGSLEADGDCIMLLFREDVFRYQEQDYSPSGIIEVNVAKNKDGAMGEVPLSFSGATQRIGDAGPRSLTGLTDAQLAEYGL